MKSILITSFLFFFNIFYGFSQPDPYNILKAVNDKLAKVKNYTADVLIKIDVETIKIKDRKARISYTHPDKFEFKADGFILLPKNSGQGDFLKILHQKSNAIYIGEEMINNTKTSIIKVIPAELNSDIILAELWIDIKKSLVVRMKTYTKQSGSYTVNFEYANNPFDLPERVIVEFDLKGIKLPSKFSGDLEDLSKQISKGNTKGKVILIYSNYQINK